MRCVQMAIGPRSTRSCTYGGRHFQQFIWPFVTVLFLLLDFSSVIIHFIQILTQRIHCVHRLKKRTTPLTHHATNITKYLHSRMPQRTIQFDVGWKYELLRTFSFHFLYALLNFSVQAIRQLNICCRRRDFPEILHVFSMYGRRKKISLLTIFVIILFYFLLLFLLFVCSFFMFRHV